MNKILIIEDDLNIAQKIKEKADKWNFNTKIIKDFKKILEAVKEFEPDIILLDLYLPNYDGYHWCQEIRKDSNVPIIFISSANDNMNIIMAMNLGADDFITKPFDQDVLIAKINALLRRSYNYKDIQTFIEFKDVRINLDKQNCEYRGNSIELTKNEYGILLVLMENHSKVVSREKIMNYLWKSNEFIDENTLSVNVNRLRKKLKANGLENFIKTKFGVGYIIE